MQAMAWAQASAQPARWLSATKPPSDSSATASRASRGASSVRRCAKARRAPTACMRPMKRPIRSSTAASSSSGARPAQRGETAKRCRPSVPGRSASVAGPSSGSRRTSGVGFVDAGQGATTGTSAAASSSAKPCSSRICASLQRARPVELGDHGAAVFQEDLEDAVLVGIELQDAAVAAQADRVERVEHLRRASGRRSCAVHRRGRGACAHGTRTPATLSDGCAAGAVLSTTDASSPGRGGPLTSRTETAAAQDAAEGAELAGRAAVGRLSAPKNESWKKPESCHSAVRSRRREAAVLASGSRALVDAGCRLRPARGGRALRHQQLQFGDRRQVVDRAAQVAHAAGASTDCLICSTRRELPRSVSRSIAASTRPLALQMAKVTWIAPSSSYQ